jgi:hypothetical protein
VIQVPPRLIPLPPYSLHDDHLPASLPHAVYPDTLAS